jgi:hypothetical protein
MGSRSNRAPTAPVDHSSVVCTDCRAVAPPADEDTTLISIAHGWRCVRGLTSAGRAKLDWWCPSCWAERRKKGGVSERRPKQ